MYSLWQDLSHGTISFYHLTLTLKFDLLLKNFNRGCYLLVVAAWRASLSSENSYFHILIVWNWFEWNLAGVLLDKCRFTCGEIIHCWQVLLVMTLMELSIFGHLSLPPLSCYNFEWNWINLAGICHHMFHMFRCTLERLFMFYKFCQSYGPWSSALLLILACLLNPFYSIVWILMQLGRDVLHCNSKCACEEIIRIQHISSEVFALGT